MIQKHPIQPLQKDRQGTLRFKKNEIVAFLLEDGPFDLVSIGLGGFSQEDREQFAQLIGVSLDRFCNLDYAKKETCDAAERSLDGVDERDARIESLERRLEKIRQLLGPVVDEVFADPDRG